MSLRKLNDWFDSITRSVSTILGRAPVFISAVIIVIVWATCGPLFKFSDTWQLVINTGTTIITFLMVFVIQNTQNRDSIALHMKLDELIKNSRASNVYEGIEDKTENEIRQLREKRK
jgi:low affinity Fe/Cu permease